MRKINKEVEILAPVGSPDTLEAAVRTGADAVYLGLGRFNARRNAGNFSNAELTDAVRYCHEWGVKVYLTLNILVSDDEIDDALESVRFACSIGVDALIVQDPGLARLVRAAAPDMPLHASTQMSVHTVKGVRELERLGYTRVCLAREMSAKQIKEIADNTDIELEVFVHGAHCMSVSGCCYLSAVLGGRSGNRGLCAQPCRLPFAVQGGTGNDLSLKDLSIVNNISELSDMGVCSFKIEGRMKRPEYVAAAVTACRGAIDGDLDSKKNNALRGIFSRSGFTDGYYSARLGRHMFGVRSKDDIASPELIKSLHSLYRTDIKKVPVDMFLSVMEGQQSSLSVSDGQHEVTVFGDVPERAKSLPLSAERAEAQISKTGATPYYVDSAECEIERNITLSAGSINALRREALQKLSEQRTEVVPIPFEKPHIAARESGVRRSKKLVVRVGNADMIPDNIEKASIVFLPPNCDLQIVKELTNRGISVGVDIPKCTFGNEGTVIKLTKDMKKSGAEYAMVHSLAGISVATNCGLKPFGGYGLNVFNGETVRLLADVGFFAYTASFELDTRQISRLDACLPQCVYAYGRLPLMQMHACPSANGHSCAECGNKSTITDRKGVSFPLRCSFGCTALLNSRPLWVADIADDFPTCEYMLLDFTTETADECREIINQYERRLPAPNDYTRGLYKRGVK